MCWGWLGGFPISFLNFLQPPFPTFNFINQGICFFLDIGQACAEKINISRFVTEYQQISPHLFQNPNQFICIYFFHCFKCWWREHTFYNTRRFDFVPNLIDRLYIRSKHLLHSKLKMLPPKSPKGLRVKKR